MVLFFQVINFQVGYGGDHLFYIVLVQCNEECDEAGHFRNSQKPIFLKKLQKVWNKWPCFSEANTLLIDDSPYKGSQNIVRIKVSSPFWNICLFTLTFLQFLFYVGRHINFS